MHHTSHISGAHDFLTHAFDLARTHFVWQNKTVEPELLKKLFDHVKWAPTSANCLPLRVCFVQSPAAKEKLLSAIDEGNIEKTKTAPVNAVLAYDEMFYDQLPKLFPHADARSWFAGDVEKAKKVALTNAALQVGYFIIAARALGLDCGPMTGFSPALTDQLFFAQTPNYKSFVVCNLGYGDASRLYPRLPRLSFEEACQIV